jgi:hypothetical protein
MSDYQVSPNWWVASDGKWYPPEQHPNFAATGVTAATSESSADIWADGTSGAQSPPSTAWDEPGTPRLPVASGASGSSGARTPSGGLWTKKLPWLGVAFVGLSVMLLLFGISGSTRGEEAQIDSSASDPTLRSQSELDPDAINPRRSTTSSLPRQTTVPTTIPTTTIATTTLPPTTVPPTTVAFTVPPEAIAAVAAAQAQAQAAEAARVAQEQADAQARAAADAYVPPPTTGSSGSGLSFASCAAARAAGAAPLYRGEPGYSSRLDRDNDGTACE